VRAIPGLGITRLGFLTGLDRLGIPVAQAVRPLARTISVHSGKGLTDAQAIASVLGEATEYAAIERFCRVDCDGTAREVSEARFIGGTNGPADLCQAWVRTEPIAGPAFLVPLAQVRMDFGELHPLAVSSNGNAAGTTREAAVLAGLLEVVERDAVADWIDREHIGRSLDSFAPDLVADNATRAAIVRARAGGVQIRFHALSSRTRIPVVSCQILDTRPDRIAGRVAVGTAARPTLAEAVRDALTEAAQVRLTRISGARDDMIPPHQEDEANGFGVDVPLPPGRSGRGLAKALFAACVEDDPLAWAVSRVVAAGFPEIGFVDLAFPGCPLAVVKVVVPGMRDMPPPAFAP
jgi:ribosomal protein S12 methylthiotransferase accessory factor